MVRYIRARQVDNKIIPKKSEFLRHALKGLDRSHRIARAVHRDTIPWRGGRYVATERKFRPRRAAPIMDHPLRCQLTTCPSATKRPSAPPSACKSPGGASSEQAHQQECHCRGFGNRRNETRPDHHLPKVVGPDRIVTGVIDAVAVIVSFGERRVGDGGSGRPRPYSPLAQLRR